MASTFEDHRFGARLANPRHDGHWKKEDSPRYKLEQMLKLNEAELLKVFQDKDAPLFERKVAGAIAESDWKTMESMINQVYGLPKQVVEQMNVELKPILPKPVFDKVQEAKLVARKTKKTAKKKAIAKKTVKKLTKTTQKGK